MTTATDWDVRDTETNDRLTVTDVQARIDQLDGAATEAPVQEVKSWVAKTPAHITPAPTCGMCGGPETGRTDPTRRTTDGDLPARTWARMSGAREWPQIPDTALTEYGRAQAEYDSAHQQIQDLRDLAFWAEQQQRKIVSKISDEYRARRSAMEDRYETEIARLHSKDDDATYAAYVQALPDYVRGHAATVASGRHASVYSELAPERIQAPDVAMIETSGHGPDDYPPPEHERQGRDPDLTPEHERRPDDRVQRMTERVQRRAIAPAETEQDRTEPPQSEPERRRSWWRSEWVAAAGIVVGWVAIIATVVVLA